MASFDHVQNETLRAILQGHVAAATNTLLGAIDVSAECLAIDTSDEAIPFHAIDAREAALNRADIAMVQGDNASALEALRAFWLV